VRVVVGNWCDAVVMAAAAAAGEEEVSRLAGVEEGNMLVRAELAEVPPGRESDKGANSHHIRKVYAST